MSIKAYKGFNKDMKCRDYQFEEGKTYHEDEAKMCEKGFHACLDPLDCFIYYDPAHSVYHEVEIDDVTDEKREDSKICGKTLKVGAALDLAGLIKARLEYVKSNCAKEIKASGNEPISGGYRSAVSGGDRSAVSGGYSSAVSGGDRSAVSGGFGSAVSGGSNSVLATFNGKAKAGLNSLIALANREWNGIEYVITDFAAAIVDGKTIKSDTWYTLKGGKFVEVEDDEE